MLRRAPCRSQSSTSIVAAVIRRLSSSGARRGILRHPRRPLGMARKGVVRVGPSVSRAGRTGLGIRDAVLLHAFLAEKVPGPSQLSLRVFTWRMATATVAASVYEIAALVVPVTAATEQR